MEIGFLLYGASIIVTLFFFVIHAIYMHQLWNHMEKSHPKKLKDLKPKSFFGIPQEVMESRNYFKEIIFCFSDDHFSDTRILHYKNRVRLFLIFALSSGLITFGVFVCMLIMQK